MWGRLFIMPILSFVLLLVRPHHHSVPGTRHAVRKLHGGLVTPLRVAILLLVALARSMVLPQDAASSAALEINFSPCLTLMQRASYGSSHARNLQRRYNLSRRHALDRYTCKSKVLNA